MEESTSAFLGFLVAPVVTGVLFAIYCWVVAYPEVQTDFIIGMLTFGIFYSAIITILLGIPVFFLLRRFGFVRWWTACPMGFVLGAPVGIFLAAIKLLPPTLWVGDVTRNFIALGIIGIVSGFVFWIIWKQGIGRPKNRGVRLG